MTQPTATSRLRAYFEFIAAIVYFFLARSVAHHSATGLASDALEPLLEQAMLVFLLFLGYAAFGIAFDRQKRPMREQGFPPRKGWPTEVGTGLALGWGVAVACVLAMALVGGVAIALTLHASAFAWLVADVGFFFFATLAEEMAFRGYGFQRFEQSVGPVAATLGFAAFYAVVQAMQPGASHASIAVSLVFGLVLSIAYLRTRALWMSWGMNFGWKASRALLFGLTVAGVNNHSPILEGDPMGPFWLTGGGYGLDASWFAFLLLLLAIPVLYRVTRELDFAHNAPVLVPGGIPVDIDAAARQQHETAMGAAQTTAAPSLVQIAPAISPAPADPASAPAPDKPAGFA